MDVYSVINGLGLYEVIKFVCRALKFNFRDIAINLTAAHVYIQYSPKSSIDSGSFKNIFEKR